MQGAESPYKIDSMNADDFAIRKQFSKNVRVRSVVGIVKRGNEHQPIRNVEVGVAGRQPLIAKDDRTRQRQFDNGELLAVGGRGQPSGVRNSLPAVRGWRLSYSLRRR